MFLWWNITWISYTGAVQFGIFDDQVLNPKGGCRDFWKRKNNYLKETTATTEYTWLLLMRTRCLLLSCLNRFIIFVEIRSSPGEVFHLLWTTICKSSTRLSHYLPVPEYLSASKTFFSPPSTPHFLNSQVWSLSPQHIEISKVMFCAIVYIGFQIKKKVNSDLKYCFNSPRRADHSQFPKTSNNKIRNK